MLRIKPPSNNRAAAIAAAAAAVLLLALQNYTALLAAQGVSREAANAYMRLVLARPSASCCTAHCRFQQQLLCDCEPTVLDVAVRFAGADNAFYGLLVAQLAAGCGHKIFFNETCPANRTAALISSASASLGLIDGAAAPSISNVDRVVIDGHCILENGTTAADSSTLLPTAAAGVVNSSGGNSLLVPVEGSGGGGGSGTTPGK
jgi:translation initiation factor 2B subunit (eIF-2B alpha/beta/delta family)